MNNQSYSIKKMISFLNNEEENGGFWLPNIQRPFVWSTEQICFLFDSIMREYPISTLLMWKTASDVKCRKFIDNWKESLKLSDFYVPGNRKKKYLVLDGQQRLQSLYIGLSGSFEGKELYFNVLTGEHVPADEVKYKFEFLDKKTACWPWYKMKDIVSDPKKETCAYLDLLRNDSLAKDNLPLTPMPVDYYDLITDNIDKIHNLFKNKALIGFQELDSIEQPDIYGENDVVEIFIRANSGGTKLEKSDLLFSLLSTTWDEADERTEELLEQINRHGYKFERDFILKTCLVLLNEGAAYEVAKFRKTNVRDDINKNWVRISNAIIHVVDFIRTKTFITDAKPLTSALALIPYIYAYYHFPKSWDGSKDKEAFIVRLLLAGTMSNRPDKMIDTFVTVFKKNNGINVRAALDALSDEKKNLRISKDAFFDIGYGSKLIHVVFSLWYSPNEAPAYTNNLPQIDHIFPQSALKQLKMLNPETNKAVVKYRNSVRDQLANCMLLTRHENQSKTDTLPSVWFKNRDDAYLEKHRIPKDPALWEIERYEDFIEARKKLILNKFPNGYVELR